MNTFLKISTKEVLTRQEIIDLYPNKSFSFNQQFYDEEGLEVIFPSPLPSINKFQCLELRDPILIGKTYHENWKVIDCKFSKEEKVEIEKSIRKDLKEKLKFMRFEKEVLGITLPDGTKINTSRESQAQITNVYLSLKNKLIQFTEWKTPEGWVQVDEKKMSIIATAVAEYVKFCFTAERLHNEAIDAIKVGDSGNLSKDFEELDNYDLEQYWPKNT